MRRVWFVLLAGSGLIACQRGHGTRAPVSQARRAYGEAPSGFPSWKERMIQVLVNRARSDPVRDLESCADCADKDCYTTALPPLVWDERLNKAARFHARNLTDSGCGMQHDSPCTLVSTIGQDYPDRCDGSVSCACVAGVADCRGGSLADRLGLFGVSGTVGENIADNGDPFDVFYQWLHEPTSDSRCERTDANGHRWNILSPDYASIGVGADGQFVVQDFWSRGSPVRVPAGAHYPQQGTEMEFRANWYDSQAPLGAYVNVEGQCYEMRVERGTARNGTFLYRGQIPARCVRYYFVFYDASNQPVFYPDTGSFGIGCSFDWTQDRPPLGPGCGCTPSCAGKECGDDGCGGSCGDCGDGLTCDDGRCVCAGEDCNGECCREGQVCYKGSCCTPSCMGRECGDDGCGGRCGVCAPGLVCTASGQCGDECEPGLVPCDDVCVDTDSDPLNCGRCGWVCPPGDTCQGGQCVCEGCVADGGLPSDGGAIPADHVIGGCGCHSDPGPLLPGGWLLGLAILVRRRRR